MELLKVKKDSRSAPLAGAIAGTFRKDKIVQLQAIGAGAINQVIKAFVLASMFLKEEGYEVILVPEITFVDFGGKQISAVRFTVEQR